MPIITSLYAAVLALLLIVLAMRVVAARRSFRVGLGTGGHAQLESRVRAHGNAIEYVPMLLLLLLLLEACGLRAMWLHVLGIGIVVSRLLHAHGLARSHATSFGRFAGAGLSFLLMVVMAIVLLVLVLPRMF